MPHLENRPRRRQCLAWAPRAEIAPHTSQPAKGMFRIASNGSAGCYGGWDLHFDAPQSSWVRVSARAQPNGLERGLDSVRAAFMWDSDADPGMNWEPVIVVREDEDGFVFEGEGPVPAGATSLIVRLLLCWSGKGSLCWLDIRVEESAAPPVKLWRLGAGGGPTGLTSEATVAGNTEAYLDFCREAAATGIDLLCLPEVMLTSGMPSTPEAIAAQAITIPGPEIEPFQAFCRENRMILCFSAWERRQELVSNTAILIDRRGELAGTYRKVHLASPLEPWWGVTPGHDFPVHEVEGTRIAMNICMDSSVEESARVPAMQGAELLCMPIMGDHRAVTGWDGGPSDWDVDRWRAIQSVRAMDNQLTMVISVNSGPGSCIISSSGDVLDMLQGRRRVAWADVDLNRLSRSWLHASFRGVNQWVRRQPAYTPLLQQTPGCI